MPTARGARERARAEITAEIVRAGRAQLATDGAAALSLRAVARELGMVSSAVYRYVASRDELLTLLVVDAYDELAGAVEAAVARRRAGDYQGRLLAAGHAVRDWAVAEPARYVDPATGTVLIRLVNDNSDGVGFSLDLSITGDVK